MISKNRATGAKYSSESRREKHRRGRRSYTPQWPELPNFVQKLSCLPSEKKLPCCLGQGRSLFRGPCLGEKTFYKFIINGQM